MGRGFSGLAAGIYSQMNGYRSQIFEMHNLPGGLCTAWKRKGYTIDGCISWLVGSSPHSAMHRYWEEVGVAQGRKFINLEEFMRYEGIDGRTLILFTNVDKLEKHLLEFSPQDTDATSQLIQGIRLSLAMDQSSPSESIFRRIQKKIKVGMLFIFHGREMQKWMRTTAEEFTTRFQDPIIRGALREMWLPEFSMFFMLFTFAFLHKKNAGYPIGGSLPMSQAMAQRYLDLGGTIKYESRVKKILIDNNKAVGVRLEDGSEYFADRIISAADGHTTLFKMLEGNYLNEEIKERYETWSKFPSLLYIGLGVNRLFDDEPKTVSGLNSPLRQSIEIGGEICDRLSVRFFNHDPTLAPVGKTMLVVSMRSSRYEYWKELAQNRKNYEAEKEKVGHTIVELLDQRFPGIAQDVEMIDVAMPLTFERYTGNWEGCFEGWLITPQNSSSIIKPLQQTLPRLQNFYMCGQWVEPGGGLPTAVMSGRRLIRAICTEDGKKFQSCVGSK